jgi:hypothetical protein
MGERLEVFHPGKISECGLENLILYHSPQALREGKLIHTICPYRLRFLVAVQSSFQAEQGVRVGTDVVVMKIIAD